MEKLEELLGVDASEASEASEMSGEVEATTTKSDVVRATKPAPPENPYANVDDRISKLMSATAAYVAAKQAAEASAKADSSEGWTWSWWMILLVVAFLGVGAWFVYSWWTKQTTTTTQASRAGREGGEDRDG